MRRALAMTLILSSFGGAASAQQAQQVTVKNLLAQDFSVVGTFIRESAGAGVFLQKKDKLFFCLVAETPTSTTVATRYCKPVE